MPLTPWDESDPATQRIIIENLKALWPDIEASAKQGGRSPSNEQLKEWHARIVTGVQLVLPEAAGAFRGEGPDRSILRTYRIEIGGLIAVEPQLVGAEMAALERALADKVDADRPAARSEEHVRQAVADAAWAHGEMIRIHPFADGNGRLARILANWFLVHADLPPALRLRPRPQGMQFLLQGRPTDRYAQAGTLSMMGNHRLLERYILEAVETALGGP